MSDRVAGYDLDPVTRTSFLAALARVLGPDDAKVQWEAGCAAAALNANIEDPAAEDLERVANALIQMGGLPSVVGSSMYVRIVTYRTLSKTTADTAGGTNE